MELISRDDAINDVKSWVAVDEYEKHLKKIVIEWLKEFPPAELGTDCISRQAAIDGLRGYLVGKRCPDDGTFTCRLIENEVINKLPSAQPEIVRCKDCLMHGVCRFERGLGLDGYCSQAERRTDG